MRVIGYGICGDGESKRYLEKTLDEFQRLCDKTIILGNNISHGEREMIKRYGFMLVEDNREWGIDQWKIKQDFLKKEVSRIATDGDMMVCLDMDEVIPRLDKQWILNAPLDAYQVFIVDLWNDELHYKPESCFWNVRLWRWNGDCDFKQKPVHCGLAPMWAYHYNRFAPFILLHYGLMTKADRQKKIARYAKYDPTAKHLEQKFYDMLAEDDATFLNEPKISATIEKEVSDYKQTKPRMKEPQPAKRYAYIKNQHGVVLDIPEAHLEQTLKRPGFSFVGWSDDVQAEMEELFAETPLYEDPGDQLGTFTPEQQKTIEEGLPLLIPPKKKRVSKVKSS